ncbi:hypothetical protein L7F22_060839 [Adiantum nelumboides]|nr:hypothetical protein [Adiantum nelumboides]
MEKEKQFQLQAQKLKAMEDRMLQTHNELKKLEDHNQTLSMEVTSSHKTLVDKEKQLEKTRKDKELIEQGMMSKYLVQSLQDIASPKGTITLEIADAQAWMDKIKAELEDKAETYTQALVNEIVVEHYQDTLNNEDEDEEEDDDEEKTTEGTSGQDPGYDDDNDDQNDPPSGTGPSSSGANTVPENPPDAQPKPPPPAPKGGSQGQGNQAFDCRGSQEELAAAGQELATWLGNTALYVQGKGLEAEEELGRLSSILTALPPEANSPEMEMVAQGLGKHLSYDERCRLLEVYVKGGGSSTEMVASDALGLRSTGKTL